jgi:membrane associated rhomboid family serine protease
MIPLRDNAAPRRLTPINVALIAANIAVFVYELSLGPRVAAFVERFALVPEAVTRALSSNAYRDAGALAPLMTTVTSMFIHGGLWHVATCSSLGRRSNIGWAHCDT